MSEKKEKLLSDIIDGVTACFRVTFCTCFYREPGEGICDHCRITGALMAASKYIADCKDQEGG